MSDFEYSDMPSTELEDGDIVSDSVVDSPSFKAKTPQPVEDEQKESRQEE